MSNHSQNQVEAALASAEKLRIRGLWDVALALLAEHKALAAAIGVAARAAHALAVARILNDKAGFGGFDTWVERSQLLDMALADAEQTRDKALLGAIWDTRGMSLHHQFLDTGRAAEPPDELPSFERGLELRREANDQPGIAESLFHVGLVHGVVRQDHRRALLFFQESYDLAQSLGDDIMASYAVRHIGFAQYDAGDVAQARASMQKSLALRERAGWVPGVAMARVGLAYANAEVGEHAAALDELEQAKQIFVELNAPQKVAWVEGMIEEFASNQS